MNKVQAKLSRQNHQKAWEYFLMMGQIPLISTGWVLHHKDPSWKHEDIERYIQWNIDDLIPMTNSEHFKWHNEGERNPFYGKTFSKESKEKIVVGNKEWREAHQEEWHKNQSKAVSNRNKTMWKNKDYAEYMVKKMHESQSCPVICVESNVSYDSLNDAMRDTGISKYFIKKSIATSKPVCGLTFKKGEPISD